MLLLYFSSIFLTSSIFSKKDKRSEDKFNMTEPKTLFVIDCS